MAQLMQGNLKCWAVGKSRVLVSGKGGFFMLDTTEGGTITAFLVPDARQVISNKVNDHKCQYFQDSEIFCGKEQTFVCAKVRGM